MYYILLKNKYFYLIINVLIVLLLFNINTKFKNTEIEYKYLSFENIDKISNIIFFGLLIYIVLFILKTAGLNSELMIKFSGYILLIILYCIQTFLYNVISGIIILLSSQYKINDIIIINDEIFKISKIGYTHVYVIDSYSGNNRLIPNNRFLSDDVEILKVFNFYQYTDLKISSKANLSEVKKFFNSIIDDYGVNLNKFKNEFNINNINKDGYFEVNEFNNIFFNINFRFYYDPRIIYYKIKNYESINEIKPKDFKNIINYKLIPIYNNYINLIILNYLKEKNLLSESYIEPNVDNKNEENNNNNNLFIL